MTEPKYGVWGDEPPARFCVSAEEHYEDCVRDPEAYGYTKEQAIAQLRYVHLEGSENMTDLEIAQSEERYERALARAERELYTKDTFRGLPSLSELASEYTASIKVRKPDMAVGLMLDTSEGIDPIGDLEYFNKKVAISSPPSTYELLARIEKLEAQVQQLQASVEDPAAVAEFMCSYNEQYEYDPKAMLEDFYWAPCRPNGFSPAPEYRMTREGRKIEQPKNKVFYVDVGDVVPASAEEYLRKIKEEILARPIPKAPTITETYTSQPDSQKVGRGSRVEVLPGGDDIVTYKVKRSPHRTMWYVPAGVERAEREQALIDYDRAMKMVK